MNRPLGLQDMNGSNQEGGFAPNPQVQHYQQGGQMQPTLQPDPQMMNPSGVRGVVNDMQNMHINPGPPPYQQQGGFPGGEAAGPFGQQHQQINASPNMPPQGQVQNMQPGQYQQQNFGPLQQDRQGMLNHPGGTGVGGAGPPAQGGFPQNYQGGQGPGMQPHMQAGMQMGPQSLSPPPPPPHPTGGMMMFNGQSPANTPHQAPQSQWQTPPPGPPHTTVQTSASYQAPQHGPHHVQSSAPQQPPYQSARNSLQPDPVPETPPSICGIDPPKSNARESGMPNQISSMGGQGYPGFPNQVSAPGELLNGGQGMMNSQIPAGNQQAPPSPCPSPPQPTNQPHLQSQPGLQTQQSGPSYPFAQNQNGGNAPGQQTHYPTMQQGNFGAPQMNPVQNTGFGGQSQGGLMQRGGFNQGTQEAPGQTFGQEGGNATGFRQNMEGDPGFGNTQGFLGQAGGHLSEESLQAQKQNRVAAFVQDSINQNMGQGPKMDQVPDEEEEEEENGEPEEEDLDVVASRITQRLMAMSKANQEAFLDKVFDKIGHENVLDAMIETFGIERVKMAALNLSNM